MRTGIRLASIALLLAGLGYVSARWYKLHYYPKWFEAVQVGDEEAAVRLKMGSPDSIQRRPAPLWCHEPDCQVEFLYGHSVPPEWWAVGFNGRGRVVWKYYLVSP